MSQKVNIEKTLVFGCLHTPYQHVPSFDAMLDFIRYWKPDRIIENGDIHDLWSASKFYKGENRKANLQYEIDAGVEANTRLRKAAGKSTEIIFNWGNHEFRWDRYINENAPELAGIRALQLEEAFGLNANNIIPNRGRTGTYARYMLGEIQVGHFEVARKHSAATEKSLVEDKGISVIASHSHRKGSFYKSLADGRVLQGMGTGCMCDPDLQDYIEDPNWQLGFVLVEKLVDRNRYILTDMPCVGGNILYEGKLY